MVGAGEWAAIEQLVDRLKVSYPEVSPDAIVTVVHQNHARFDGRPVRDFVRCSLSEAQSESSRIWPF